MRKCLAVLLSLLMLLGTMPASSFAAELDLPESAAAEAEPAGDQFTEAAESDVPEQEELPEPEDPASAGTESGSEEELPAEEGEPDVPETPYPWLGKMPGNWEDIRKAGIDWFLMRWLCSRNVLSGFCLMLILAKVATLIFG